MKALFYLTILIIAAVVAMFFAVLNPGEVELNLYFTKFNLPFATTIILSMFFGVLLGFVVSAMGLLGKASEIRKLNKQKRDLQTELNLLRKQPIEDS